MAEEKNKEKPAIFVFTTAYDPFIGGAEVAIKEVAKRLKNEFRFFIFTSRFRANLPRQEVQDGIFIRRIGIGFLGDRFLLPFIGPLVVWLYLRKERPALFWAVMATYASGIPYILNIFRFGKLIPVVLTLQEGDSIEHIQKARFGLIGVSWRAALRRTHYLTAISTYLLKLGKEFGYRGEAKVIPNGVDVSAFVREFLPDDLKIFREGLGIALEEKVVITTSRLVKKNAVDIAIRALAILIGKGRRIKFLILGSGDEERSLRRLAGDLDVLPHVLFLGSVPHAEIPKYLKISDVFVRASRSEGLGNSFIEAMAAGLPIIGTMVGGIVDFLEDGKTGLAVKVNDPDDLAAKIDKLISDPVLRSRLSEEGARVAGSFNWEIIAKQYSSVFAFASAEYAKPVVLIATGLFPPDIGGPATYSKLFLDEMPARGFVVKVLSFGEVRRMPKIIRHAAYLLKLFGKARLADIIFAQDPVSVGVPAMFVAKILRKKFVMKIVGDYAWEQAMQRFSVLDLLNEFLGRRYGIFVEILRKLQRTSARAANLIIVPSAYLKGVIGRWGVDQKKVRVVYNACETGSAPFSYEEARKGLHLNGTVAVSVGRLVPWKGFEVLIECVHGVSKVIPDFKLIIVGSGPEEANLKSKVKELALVDCVSFVGGIPHNDVLAFFRASDLFVLNTGYEGFSHTILEAMAMGTPVVTTKVGGNTEIIKDGENGFLVEYNDGVALTNTIIRLCQSRVLRDKVVANAEKTLSAFTKARMIKETSDIFLSI
ncbi:MAG: glycosyltransferase family 4 protein [bacterium]|nr:glycosyltransferase family 4 protein [bacterium]